jgi:hypothetical protein
MSVIRRTPVTAPFAMPVGTSNAARKKPVSSSFGSSTIRRQASSGLRSAANSSAT